MEFRTDPSGEQPEAIIFMILTGFFAEFFSLLWFWPVFSPNFQRGEVFLIWKRANFHVPPCLKK
jgi:hypothetical protein